ncbi:MAG: hypothetical protein IPO88_03030 [Nannocystis sp.]|nr:hypothetical protein [Nannocystis sp.]
MSTCGCLPPIIGIAATKARSVAASTYMYTGAPISCHVIVRSGLMSPSTSEALSHTRIDPAKVLATYRMSRVSSTQTPCGSRRVVVGPNRLRVATCGPSSCDAPAKTATDPHRLAIGQGSPSVVVNRAPAYSSSRSSRTKMVCTKLRCTPCASLDILTLTVPSGSTGPVLALLTP